MAKKRAEKARAEAEAEAEKRTKETKEEKAIYLKGHGHEASEVDTELAGDDLAGLRKLHGVTVDEYEAGKR